MKWPIHPLIDSQENQLHGIYKAPKFALYIQRKREFGSSSDVVLDILWFHQSPLATWVMQGWIGHNKKNYNFLQSWNDQFTLNWSTWQLSCMGRGGHGDPKKDTGLYLNKIKYVYLNAKRCENNTPRK